MFEFLFKYPAAVFSKGTFVLLGSWPVGVLVLLTALGGAALAFVMWRRPQGRGPGVRGPKRVAVWLLQTALIALILLLLWRPAVSVATLLPQQNIVAVVVDDSRSMSLTEGNRSRKDEAAAVLNGGLLDALTKRFQVRLYRLGGGLERIQRPEQLNASAPATRIGANLKEVVADAATLPIGAVVLLSDGADTTGGIDLDTVSEIRRHHIPVHTIGFGPEHMAHDLEITNLELPARVLADSRARALVYVRQHGYAGRSVAVKLRDGGRVLASTPVRLKPDGLQQTETLLFNAGPAGVKNIEVSIDPLEGEQDRENNKLTRVLNVDSSRPRILYVEGEPRWDFKFIRRAVEDDHAIELVTMLRTSQNKLYRQGVEEAHELADGFPVKVEDLFRYSGIILGSVEANYFTPAQQELLREFVDRRGGGLLFLGGRSSLADGAYNRAPFTELLPVRLPDHKNTFHREPATSELTGAGRDSLLCRIDDNPDTNAERWRKLPYLMNFQEAGNPKPGALVLANMTASGHRLPLLITQNYGRGRTAVFATGGSWRWQMLQPVADKSHEIFWSQLLRWLVTGTPARVTAVQPAAVLADTSHLTLRAEVRDSTYLPTHDAAVQARIIAPDGSSHTAELQPDGMEPGIYNGEWTAEAPGSYMAEIIARRGNAELGRDVVTFRREDGVAENFHPEQNRELLEKLASQTGGRHYTPAEASRLASEITYSEAGLSVRETKDLWDMPVLFFIAVMLRASEWLLRRKWGVV